MCLEQFFGLVFWQNLASSFLGALGGVFLAFILDRLITKRNKRSQRDELIQFLVSALKNNRDIIQRIYDEIDDIDREIQVAKDSKLGTSLLETIWFPMENVDIVPFQTTASIRYGIINNIEFNRKLDSVRYNLEDLHQKLRLIQSTGLTRSAYIKIKDSIKNQLFKTLSIINEILTIMDLQKLTK